MQWRELGEKIVDGYGKVAVWVYNNPVETDLIIGLVVVGSCVWYWRRQRRKQLRAFRIIRGALMKRKDREKFQLMKFEDAITDAAMDMVAKGEMVEWEEKYWYKFFSNLGLVGFTRDRTTLSVRHAMILRRMILLFNHSPFNFMDIPGGKPGEGVPVDKSYKPVLEEPDTRRSSSTSRYL